jgi:uncharacterized membrane protein YbhN (UPF0104 family)
MVSLGALLCVASPAELAAVVSSANPRWLAVGVVLAVAATLVAAAVFQQILTIRYVDAPYPAVLAANLAGDFYALSLPGGLAVGGAVRLLRLGRDQLGMSGVFAAILASRLLEIFLQLALALLAMPWIWRQVPSSVGWILCLGLAVLLAGCSYVAIFQRASRRFGIRLVVFALPRQSRTARRVRRILARVGRVRPVGLAFHARLLATGLLRHLIGAAAFLAFAAAAGVKLELAEALWARGVTGIAMLLPLSIAGLGLRELSYVALLGLFGIAPASALAMSLMVFGCLLLNAAAGAAIELHGTLQTVDRAGPSGGRLGAPELRQRHAVDPGGSIAAHQGDDGRRQVDDPPARDRAASCDRSAACDQRALVAMGTGAAVGRDTTNLAEPGRAHAGDRAGLRPGHDQVRQP